MMWVNLSIDLGSFWCVSLISTSTLPLNQLWFLFGQGLTWYWYVRTNDKYFDPEQGEVNIIKNDGGWCCAFASGKNTS